MPGTGCTLTTPNPEFNDSPDFAGEPSANPSTRNIVAFSVMCLGMYLALTNIQIVNSSFKEIQGGLAAGSDQIGWVLTSALTAVFALLFLPFFRNKANLFKPHQFSARRGD